MIELVENYIRSNWYTFHLPFSLPPKLAYLFLKGFRKTIFLIFKDNDSQPFAVLKVSNDPIAFDRLKKEYKTLSYLSTHESLKGSVPVPIAFFEMRGHKCLLESALEGAPLIYSIKGIGSRNGLMRMEGIYNSIIDTLIVLHNVGTTRRPARKKWAVVEHGDFNPSNLLLSRTGIKIFDWEYSILQGVPLKDFLDFSLHYVHLARYLMNEITREQLVLSDFEETFFSTKPYTQIIWENLNMYSSRIGLSKSSIRDIFSIFVGKYLNEHDSRSFCGSLDFLL